MAEKVTRRVILPLKKSIMYWFKVMDSLDVGEFGEEYNKMKEMVEGEDYTTPTVQLGNQKSTYEEYYINGFSINEIAELFDVSKQYVDTMISQNKGIKESNVKNRLKIKEDIDRKLYVRVPEVYGFDKVLELGYNSNEYLLRRKYKELGGTEIKSAHELKEEMVENVWKDFQNGMKYKDLSNKYGKKINTISNYIREKKNRLNIG